MLNHMNNLVLLSIDCLIVGVLILVFYGIRMGNKYKEKLLSQSAYTINIQAVIDESIPQILDLIINECFEDYKLLVLYPKQEFYISDEREAEIRSDLAKKVADRISPIAIDKLSLYYNVENLSNVIGEKIYIAVMNYVITVNDVKDDLKDIPSKQ